MVSNEPLYLYCNVILETLWCTEYRVMKLWGFLLTKARPLKKLLIRKCSGLYHTYWLVWRSSISRMTPFSCSLAAVYFNEACFSFLLPFTSSFPSSLIDLREFLGREQQKRLLIDLLSLYTSATLLAVFSFPSLFAFFNSY